jgi:palmitoyl transferase
MNTKKILLAFCLLSVTSVYAADEVKCETNNKAAVPSKGIDGLDQDVKKIIQPHSKWAANSLSKTECDAIIKDIDKAKADASTIPELLSAIDIIKAECGLGDDPKVVVKDVIPFTIQNTNLYFEWDDNGKLIIKHDKKLDDKMIVVEYSKKDLTENPVVLSVDQQKLFDSKKADLSEVQDSTGDKKNIVSRWWEGVKGDVSKIVKEGTTEVYVPSIAYHDRSTYTPDKVKALNELAIGVGVGKSIKNENGNTEMLFAMVHLDSHSDVEFNAGYGWQKNFQVSDKTTVGIGYAAGVISRKDLASYTPIPFVLPMASVEYGKKYSVNGVLIPKLNGGINHGNVLFIFGKYEFDK